jgi:glycosyltransferase involved in cell wall biosynthesis
MRILNVKANMHSVWGGGTAERTLQMSRAISKDPSNLVTLLTLDIGLSRERLNQFEDFQVASLNCINERFQIPIFNPARLNRLIRNTDMIHLMGHWTILNALVYRKARLLKKPYVVCPAGTLDAPNRQPMRKRIYSSLFGNDMLQFSDCLIAITEKELQQFAELGIEKAKSAIIPNGIDPDQYPACESGSFLDEFEMKGIPYILFMGRLHPIKGPDLLLESFTRIDSKKHRLVFAGPDEGMGSQLKELAGQIGIADRVHFLGFLSGKKKLQALQAADLVVIPSRKEAMSIVVLESGVCGTPVVITDQCGFDTVLDIGGGLVVSATVEGLTMGINRMLSQPHNLILMGERLRKMVIEKYSWNSLGQQLVSLYEGILCNRKERKDEMLWKG